MWWVWSDVSWCLFIDLSTVLYTVTLYGRSELGGKMNDGNKRGWGEREGDGGNESPVYRNIFKNKLVTIFLFVHCIAIYEGIVWPASECFQGMGMGRVVCGKGWWMHECPVWLIGNEQGHNTMGTRVDMGDVWERMRKGLDAWVSGLVDRSRIREWYYVHTGRYHGHGR